MKQWIENIDFEDISKESTVPNEKVSRPIVQKESKRALEERLATLHEEIAEATEKKEKLAKTERDFPGQPWSATISGVEISPNYISDRKQQAEEIESQLKQKSKEEGAARKTAFQKITVAMGLFISSLFAGKEALAQKQTETKSKQGIAAVHKMKP